ncbi:hypothetical protein LQZ18_16010 [Lachnospiraceae bacterium ZAX-1]
MKSITDEYGISKSAISSWRHAFSKECQTIPAAKEDYNNMMETQKLHQRLDELEKENRFLKKAAAFFAKEIDSRSIDLFKAIGMNLEYDGF